MSIVIQSICTDKQTFISTAVKNYKYASGSCHQLCRHEYGLTHALLVEGKVTTVTVFKRPQKAILSIYILSLLQPPCFSQFFTNMSLFINKAGTIDELSELRFNNREHFKVDQATSKTPAATNCLDNQSNPSCKPIPLRASQP